MRCMSCKKKSTTILCKWCNYDYCTSCIQIETHCCSNLQTALIQKKEHLVSQLKNQQTNSDKNFTKI